MDEIRLTSPRFEGIREQFERAKLLVKEAQNSNDCLFRFRHVVAAIYPARAVVELILEAADKQETSKSRGNLEQVLIAKLPRYYLIEKMRIHDFHRFGLIQRKGMFVGGPLKLQTIGKGEFAAMFLTAKGLLKKTSKGSAVKEQRPLQMQEDRVFDETTDQWVSIETVLTEYLQAMPTVIEEFRKPTQSQES